MPNNLIPGSYKHIEQREARHTEEVEHAIGDLLIIEKAAKAHNGQSFPA